MGAADRLKVRSMNAVIDSGIAMVSGALFSVVCIALGVGFLGLGVVFYELRTRSRRASLDLLLAWLVRIVIFIPGMMVITLAWLFGEADLWSTGIITKHRQERWRRNREEMMSPQWPWT